MADCDALCGAEKDERNLGEARGRLLEDVQEGFGEIREGVSRVFGWSIDQVLSDIEEFGVVWKSVDR